MFFIGTLNGRQPIMTDNHDFSWDNHYRRAADVIHRDIGGEHILVPVKGNLADLRCVFTLNPVAAAIWEKLDGSRALAAIREELLAEYQVDDSAADIDIAELIAQLAEAGLLEVVP